MQRSHSAVERGCMLQYIPHATGDGEAMLAWRERGGAWHRRPVVSLVSLMGCPIDVH